MPHVLEKVNSPADLKGLTHEQLEQLAQDCRDLIIEVITRRGWHLASNLGVVELTLALHRVFNRPVDKIVWDTTNRQYTQKIVTGRKGEFRDIRLENGLSGFGSAVLETLSDAGVRGVAVLRIGMPDEYIERATAARQRQRVGLDAEGIARQVNQAFFSNGHTRGHERVETPSAQVASSS